MKNEPVKTELPIVSRVEIRMYDHPSLPKPIFGFSGEGLNGYSKTAMDAMRDFMEALEPLDSDKWAGKGKFDISRSQDIQDCLQKLGKALSDEFGERVASITMIQMLGINRDNYRL